MIANIQSTTLAALSAALESRGYETWVAGCWLHWWLLGQHESLCIEAYGDGTQRITCNGYDAAAATTHTAQALSNVLSRGVIRFELTVRDNELLAAVPVVVARILQARPTERA